MFIFLNSVILHIDLAEKLHAVEDSLQTLVRNIINNVFSHWFSLGLPWPDSSADSEQDFTNALVSPI
jgi:hypothetical protein